MRTIFLFSILITALLPLAAGGQGEGASDPGKATGEGRRLWVDYDVALSHAGSRSEGRNHSLAINGTIVPDVFDLVYAGEVLYRFTVKTQVWGDAGYRRDPEAPAPFGESDERIGGSDWERGWYRGGDRKRGTPRSWVYVTRDGESFFVSPDEIHRLVEYRRWSYRERDLSGPKAASGTA